MPARTKGRAKVDFQGRRFVWWIDGERYLRVSSLDKKFIIMLPLTGDAVPAVEVIGPEFPGVEASERRPFWVTAPRWNGTSMGGRVHELLDWSFGIGGRFERVPPPVLGRRDLDG